MLENDGKPTDRQKRSGAAGAKIGQTAVPEKHDIICYECSYTFILSGKISNTICPKCHKSLNVGDHKVSKATQLTLKTIGTVEVTPDGKLIDGSSVVARGVTVAGNVKNARIECTGTLELLNGAELDIKNIKFKDLVVRPDAIISISRKFECRNLEISGDLTAKVSVTGLATVRPGGILRGEVYTPHLVVEDGGGLSASVSAGSAQQSRKSNGKRRRKNGAM